MIKNKDKTVKKASKKSKRNFLSNLALALVSTMVVGTGVATFQTTMRTFSNDLTPVSEVQNNIKNMGLDSSIIRMPSSLNSRFMFPKNGKVNVNIFIPENELKELKPAFVNAINEINDALALVNPKFKLVLDFEPKKNGGFYSIDVTNGDLTKSSDDVLAFWHDSDMWPTINGVGVYRGRVVVDLKRFTEEGPYSTNALKTVLLHEIAGHGILRLGDAYKHLDDFKKPTIMKFGKINDFPALDYFTLASSTFSKYDLQVLMARYAKGSDYIGWDKTIDTFLVAKKAYETVATEVEYINENKEVILKNALEKFPELKGYKASEITESGSLHYSVTKDKEYSVYSFSSDGGEFYVRDIDPNYHVATAKGSADTTMVEGVLVGLDGKYLYKCRDKVLEMECKTQENGEKTAVITGVYNSLSKEEYLKEKERLNSHTDFNLSERIGDSTQKYLTEKGFVVIPVSEHDVIVDSEKDEVIAIYNGFIGVEKEGTSKTYDNKISNGIVITKRCDVIANTSNGYKILDIEFDAKNLDVKFSNCRDCERKSPDRTHSKSNSKIK